MNMQSLNPDTLTNSWTAVVKLNNGQVDTIYIKRLSQSQIKLSVMNKDEIISKLITTRENTLSVKSIEVVKIAGSMANPCIRVGTKPFYEWDKDKQITFVITYGRYLNCEMLVYDKEIKRDKDFIIVKGVEAATKELNTILEEIYATTA